MSRGIIPARAGFTKPGRVERKVLQDHPRSRGVYGDRQGNPCHKRGSSPLARGLRAGDRRRPRGSGIIPARAGFTPHRASRSAASRDHPRSRGVYASRAVTHRVHGGSSPLARGLRRDARPYPRPHGIIPARAGFTGGGGAGPSARRDHPRSRGVYRPLTGPRRRAAGSSPLARGLRGRHGRGHPGRGIIPARAGFTRASRSSRRVSRDHPRSRGVYRAAARRMSATCGSSPLARGLPARVMAEDDEYRIIPARAGFTFALAWRRFRRRDHPRSRGVYSGASSPPRMRTGSSPLARGLQWVAGPFLCPAGIIPARAGFTVLFVRLFDVVGDHPRSRGVYSTQTLV